MSQVILHLATPHNAASRSCKTIPGSAVQEYNSVCFEDIDMSQSFPQVAEQTALHKQGLLRGFVALLSSALNPGATGSLQRR